MLIFLLNSNTQAEVKRVFDDLKELIGLVLLKGKSFMKLDQESITLLQNHINRC